MPRESKGPHLWLNKRDGRDGKPLSSVWYVVWREYGKPQRISTGATERKDAERFLAQWIEGRQNPAPPPAVTIAAILGGYLAERKGKVRAYGTLKHACTALGKHLGWLEVGHIMSRTLETYAHKRKDEGVVRSVKGKGVRKPIADGTIQREVNTLRAALRWAHGTRWIDSVPPLKMPVKAPPPRERWLTKSEASGLLNACRSEHMKLFIMLGLTTAARVGAILELTWDRVDMARGLIDFGPGHGNKRRAVVPIAPNLRPYLERAKQLAVSTHVVEYHGKPVRSIKTSYNATVKRAGLNDGVVIHTLRHTAATWSVQAGVPLAEVARLLGDSEKTVEKVYGKHSPDYLARAVGALTF